MKRWSLAEAKHGLLLCLPAFAVLEIATEIAEILKPTDSISSWLAGHFQRWGNASAILVLVDVWCFE